MFPKKRVVLLGLALVAAITLTGCSGMKLGGGSSEPSPTASASASATPTPSPSPSVDPASTAPKQPDVKQAESRATLDESLWGHMTWKYPARYAALVTKYYGADAMVTEDKVTRPAFVVGSNLPGRVWTDSVRPPITTKSIDEVYAHILNEPDYGAQVGSGLAHMSISGGKSLLELNPWLKEFNDPAGINDWAQAVMDGSPAEQLIAAKKLSLVVMLLEQLHNESVGQNNTFFNYHLVVGEVGGAMSINPNNPESVKEFELSPIQYAGEFVTVELTFKGQTGCWLKVGFNTGDGRFAGFTCETPKVTPPATPGTPGTPGTPNTPGTPGTPTTPPAETPPCVICAKDHKDDRTPIQGTTPLKADPVQPVAPAPKPAPLKAETPVQADPGPTVPVQGATPAPQPTSAPAPLIPTTQAPTPTDTGTATTDPDA